MTSNISEKLDIILITFNRAKKLDETLAQILSFNSPIRDYSIKILDNDSTDNTREIVEKYQKDFPNLKYEKNKYNVGGNANIVNAFLSADKEYVWVLADNDTYSWDGWEEVIKAMGNNNDAIFVSNSHSPQKDIACLFLQATFVPGVIYNTSLFDSALVQNMYYNVSNMFPHLAIFSKVINENKKYTIVQKQIVIAQKNDDYVGGVSFIRIPHSGVHKYMLEMSWFAGYANSLMFIEDKDKRNYIATHTSDLHTSLNDTDEMFRWNSYYNNSLYNLFCIWLALPYNDRIGLFTKYLLKLPRKTLLKYSVIVLRILFKGIFISKEYFEQNGQKRLIVRIFGIKFKFKVK